MKRFSLLIFLALLLLPAPVLAGVSECDENSTPECRCVGLVYDSIPIVNPDLEDEEHKETCRSTCETLVSTDAFGEAEFYSIQCRVDEIETVVDFGRIIAMTDNEEEEEANLGAAPILGIEIPGLKFEDNDNANYIGKYVEALYLWILSAAAILAILMFMIAGLQWMTARGDASKVSLAKDRLRNATVGIALLLGAYTIAFLINPNTVKFESLNIRQVDQQLYVDTSGEEGSTSGAVRGDCADAIQDAKQNGSCNLGEDLVSPTGGQISCNYHFSTKNYRYQDIRSLDYAASFGADAYAPISGTITYIEGTAAAATGGSRCGNKIRIVGASGSVTLCHMKDFLDNSGNAYESDRTVEAGDHIGHVGGVCGGGKAPDSWSQSDHCTATGTVCDGPYDASNCTYQHYYESGNTSGAHVHLSFNYGGDLLNCHE